MTNIFKRFTSIALGLALLCSTSVTSLAAESKPNLTKSSVMASFSAAAKNVGEIIHDEVSNQIEASDPETKPEAKPEVKTVSPSGVAYKNKNVIIDYGHASDGYVMIKYTGNTTKEIRAYVYKGDAWHAFILTPGEWATVALSNGDGKYTFKIYEAAYNGLFWNRGTFDVDAVISDPLSPFLLSTYMINYADAPNTVSMAKALTNGIADTKDKVDVIHTFVTDNISYDYARRNNNTWPYIPDLDGLLVSKKGVCLDYSALMCGMLRSIGIPAKMEYGYLDNGNYHAWVSVYIDNAWVRYDPSTYSVGYAVNPAWTVGYIRTDANYSVTQGF